MLTPAPNAPFIIAADEADAGERLDRWLAARVPDASRARLQALIRAGAVTLEGGGTIWEPRTPVKPGAVYRLDLPPATTPDLAVEPLPLDIVYEDEDVIVVDKPAGMVVHPAAGHASGTLVNALIAHCGDSLSGIGGVKRPGIVHRLDKDTSGLLVVAKNDRAHQHLSEQFQAHGRDGRLHRAYLALVWGTPQPRVGTIDAPLARSERNRTKITVTRGQSGRSAVTHYEVEATFPGATKSDAVALIRARLETGRTHQIRVHMAHISHPVLGDPVYATGFKTRLATLPPRAREQAEQLPRQALHAAELGFEHPSSGREMVFQSQLPADMQVLVAALGAATTTLRQPRKR